MREGPFSGSSNCMCCPQKKACTKMEGYLEYMPSAHSHIESISLALTYDKGDCRANPSKLPLTNNAAGHVLISHSCSLGDSINETALSCADYDSVQTKLRFVSIPSINPVFWKSMVANAWSVAYKRSSWIALNHSRAFLSRKLTFQSRDFISVIDLAI